MGRGKGRQVRTVEATELQLQNLQQLNDTVDVLEKAGTPIFFMIRRRRSGAPLFPIWKRAVAVDDVDDIKEYCYKEGGESWEYKVRVVDDKGRTVMREGQIIPDVFLPALAATPDEAAGQPGGVPPGMSQDPTLVAEEKEIAAMRQEAYIRRRRIEAERERKRLERMEAGEDEDGDEQEYYYPPPGFGPPGYPGHPGMGGYPSPYHRPDDSNQQLLAAIVTALAQPKDNGMAGMLPFITQMFGQMMQASSEGQKNGLQPKDILGFATPLMTEMARAASESNRVVLEQMSSSDKFWKTKIIEAAELGGKSDDEIEKYKRVLGLITDGISSTAQAVLGRRTVMPGEKINVPTLPGPARASINPPTTAASTAPVSAPVEQAKKIIVDRIHAFLTVHLQEMIVGSDPEWVASKIDEAELWISIPETLRAKIEALPVDKIYEVLREYDAPTVDEIFKAVSEDAAGIMRNWTLKFWEAVKHPPEDEEEPEEGEEEVEGEEEEPKSEQA